MCDTWIDHKGAKMSDVVLYTLEQAGALLDGDKEKRLAGNINVCFPGIEGKAIINSVFDSIAISAGSACTSQSVEPSHVIMALGYGEERAHSSIRIALDGILKKMKLNLEHVR